jgi:hypothetical protein
VAVAGGAVRDETALAYGVNDLARSTARIMSDWANWRERALRAEAIVRAKDETIGELLDAIDGAHAAVREVNGQIAYWESEIKNASRAVAMAKATAT